MDKTQNNPFLQALSKPYITAGDNKSEAALRSSKVGSPKSIQLVDNKLQISTTTGERYNINLPLPSFLETPKKPANQPEILFSASQKLAPQPTTANTVSIPDLTAFMLLEILADLATTQGQSNFESARAAFMASIHKSLASAAVSKEAAIASMVGGIVGGAISIGASAGAAVGAAFTPEDKSETKSVYKDSGGKDTPVENITPVSGESLESETELSSPSDTATTSTADSTSHRLEESRPSALSTSSDAEDINDVQTPSEPGQKTKETVKIGYNKAQAHLTKISALKEAGVGLGRIFEGIGSGISGQDQAQAQVYQAAAKAWDALTEQDKQTLQSFVNMLTSVAQLVQSMAESSSAVISAAGQTSSA